jgi:hypothetical protein
MADRLRTLWSRARSLGRRGRLEDDLHDELAFHLAMREAQMRDAGAPDAPTGARRRFGNVAAIRAAMRDAWVTPWWQDVGRDVRFALRLLARDRGFTLAAVLTLGLGIGANTAMYSAVGSLPVRSAAARRWRTSGPHSIGSPCRQRSRWRSFSTRSTSRHTAGGPECCSALASA